MMPQSSLYLGLMTVVVALRYSGLLTCEGREVAGIKGESGVGWPQGTGGLFPLT